MAFPQSVLDTRVELLLGSTWTNITSKIYFRDSVTITGGHPDEATRANPCIANLTVDDRTGNFAPRNPLGAYYGTIGRNTPLRISVPEQATYLRSETDTTSYATCPTSSGLGITGDLEVQIDATLDNWYAGGVSLCSKYNATGNQRSWSLKLTPGVNLGLLPVFVWSPDGTSTNAHQAVSTGLFTPVGSAARFALKATLSVATGTVTFYSASTLAGPWTQVGSPVVLGSATSVFASTAAVTVGYNASEAGTTYHGFQGKIHGFKVLSGIGGTAKASPDFTAQSDGATTFTDAQGNVWTLGGTAEISGRKYLLHGEVPAWPQRWDKTGNDVYAPIQASGLLRRLGAPGAKTLNSSMYRYYVRATGADAPIAYWPCEDGRNAANIASGLPSGAAMLISGTPGFAGNTAFLSSAPMALLSNSTWAAAIPQSASVPTGNDVQFLLSVPSTGAVNGAVIARILTSGTIARIDVSYSTGGILATTGYNAAGTQLFTANSTGNDSVDGNPVLVQIAQTKNGTGVDVNANYLTLYNFEGGFGPSTQASSTVGQITRVVFNPAGAINDTAVGHIAAFQTNTSIVNPPLTGHIGEFAGNRFARLCTEEGVPYRITGNTADTVTMGAQTPQTLLALLQECEDADRGLIYEPRHVLALGYRTRVSLYNQAAALALSYTSAQLAGELLPVDDDQLTLNDVTVNRSNGGSSVRQTLTTGALSTQSPPNGVGPYPTSPSINLQADSQLADEAGWILHTGTVDAPRYPGITVDLARSAVSGVYYAAQDVQVGDRITVANTPAWLPPDGISQLALGYTITCYGYTFRITWQCGPEDAYHIAILEDTVLGRADTDGSTLTGGPYASNATSLSVATTGAAAGSPLWTTNAPDFPFDIVVGGERMTVTNITGASSPQTFTVTRSVNGVVKTQSTGTDVRLFQPMILSL